MHELKNVSLYITFNGEWLQLALLNFEQKEILFNWSIPLSSVVPELPREIEQKLRDQGLSLQKLSAVYLFQKPSRWNSNRLVVTFVRTIGFALPISIYTLNLGKDFQTNIEELNDNESFFEFLKSFKKVSWKELKTLYNSCLITNI